MKKFLTLIFLLIPLLTYSQKKISIVDRSTFINVSDGQLLFVDGVTIVGTSGLEWNEALTRLGIGTTPAYTLDINGEGRFSDDLIIDDLIIYTPIGTPTTPAAGYFKMYNKTGVGMVIIDDTGAEIPIGAGAGSGTVTSIVSGNGMAFATITTTGTVTMGTPSTLTPSTSNGLTANSHTHSITGFIPWADTVAIVATKYDLDTLSAFQKIITGNVYYQSYDNAGNEIGGWKISADNYFETGAPQLLKSQHSEFDAGWILRNIPLRLTVFGDTTGYKWRVGGNDLFIMWAIPDGANGIVSIGAEFKGTLNVVGTLTASNLSGSNTGDQVIPDNTTATTNQFFTAYNNTTGVFTKARPTWANIDKTVSDIADIATKSHTSLTDKGSNTHAQIDTHIANITTNPHAVDYSDAGAIQDAANTVDDTHIDWGVGANQVSAVDIPIADGGVIITATEVEGALQENRVAINLNTAKVTMDFPAAGIAVSTGSAWTASIPDASSNWNTSYNRSIDSNPTFNTTDGILTFVQQDASTLTVSLDDRYILIADSLSSNFVLNSDWFRGLSVSGDTLNIWQVNEDNQFTLGVPQLLYSQHSEFDAGMIYWDIPLRLALFGDSVGFRFRGGGRELFKGYGKADGAGGVTGIKFEVNGDIFADNLIGINTGDQTTSSATTNQLTVATGGANPVISIVTGAVINGGTPLATGNEIYDFVIALGYSTTVGTITGMTVPTGFLVSGTPTLALTFDTGYSLPTTAKQIQWDAAYTHSLVTSGNPHSVTKGNVGLSVVENTALSTWAGSANITQLGTISSGVWQGTIIADSRITKSGNWTGTFDGQQGTHYLARANHTGTQLSSTISNFSTSVSGVTDVVNNTSSRHSSMTLAGTPDYITLSGQVITRHLINLTTDVSGLLPGGNFDRTVDWTGTFDGVEGAGYLKPASLQNDILNWNSSTVKYEPYSGKLSGTFYSGVSTPNNAIRLNYDGYMYATRFYGTQLFDGGDRVATQSWVTTNYYEVNTQLFLDYAISASGLIVGNNRSGDALITGNKASGTGNLLRLDYAGGNVFNLEYDGDISTIGGINISSGKTYKINNQNAFATVFAGTPSIAVGATQDAIATYVDDNSTDVDLLTITKTITGSNLINLHTTAYQLLPSASGFIYDIISVLAVNSSTYSGGVSDLFIMNQNTVTPTTGAVILAGSGLFSTSLFSGKLQTPYGNVTVDVDFSAGTSTEYGARVLKNGSIYAARGNITGGGTVTGGTIVLYITYRKIAY